MSLSKLAFSVVFGCSVSVSTVADDSALRERLCKDLPGCVTGERWDAGKTRDGQPLEVVETTWPAKNGYDAECQAQALWLHRGEGDDWRRVVRTCNDGYGAAGVGEDFFEAGAATLTHKRSGGSNWRWSSETTIGLDPLRIVSVLSDSYLSVASGCHRTLTDPALAIRLGWLHPVPEQEGDEGDIANCDFDAARPHYRAIPQLTSAFLEEGRQSLSRAQFADWRRQQVGLGNCALEFSTRDGSGFVIHGKPDDSAPATIRVLSVDELHWLVGVQVSGRKPGSSPNWIKDDRLELWIGKFLFTWAQDIEAPRQYGVRLADGRAFAGHNADAAKLPQVERWEKDGWIWLAIDFSPVQPDYGVHSATVVYGQGDGKSQGLMLASSRLKFGQPHTLGDFWSDYSHDCAVVDGQMQRTRLRAEYADPDHHDPFAADE